MARPFDPSVDALPEDLGSLEEGGVLLTLEWIGEGWSGDYDETDETDEPLARFSFSMRNEDGEWEQVPDGSYCTATNAWELHSGLHVDGMLRYLMDQLGDRVRSGNNYKKLAEHLSWINWTVENHGL